MSVLSTLTNIKLGGEKMLVEDCVISGKPTKPMNSTTAPLTRPKEKNQHIIESQGKILPKATLMFVVIFRGIPGRRSKIASAFEFAEGYIML